MRAVLLSLLTATSAWAAPDISVADVYDGAPSTVVVTGLDPGAPVLLAGALGLPGQRFCPGPIAPVCTDLGRPGRVLGMGTADPSGVAVFTFTGPAGRAAVYLQALSRAAGGVERSSPLYVTVQVYDPDTDGDGLVDSLEFAYGTDHLNPDSDYDGLRDGDEVFSYGTDPLNADTDFGGVSDFDELVLQGTNPFDPSDDFYVYDSDYDGLSDSDEWSYGTDPYNPDTDGDTVLDGDEVFYYGTDPLNWDTDGGGVSDGEELFWQGTDPLYAYDDIDIWSQDNDYDGLYDGEELYIYGTDPWSWDTDGGGVGDGDEVWQGTNPLDPYDDYGWQDSDYDGLSDYDELYLYGTDPWNYDTDYGGIGDGDEIAWGLNPFDPYDG